jgi:hypothetical protein
MELPSVPAKEPEEDINLPEAPTDEPGEGRARVTKKEPEMVPA